MEGVITDENGGHFLIAYTDDYKNYQGFIKNDIESLFAGESENDISFYLYKDD